MNPTPLEATLIFQFREFINKNVDERNYKGMTNLCYFL